MFILRRPAEKFRSNNKKLIFVFVDLEKAFDQVPNSLFCFKVKECPSMFGKCRYVTVSGL